MLSNKTLKRVSNSFVKEMNIECSTEQLERQLNPVDQDLPTILSFESSFLDSSPSYGESLASGSSSPVGPIDSDDDSFIMNVNDYNCNDPALCTGMTMSYDQPSSLLSPESMVGSPVDENNINIDNMVLDDESRSRANSLPMVPDSSQDVGNYSEPQFSFFPTQEFDKIVEGDLLTDNAELIAEALEDSEMDAVLESVLEEMSSQDPLTQDSVGFVSEYPNLVVQAREPITDNFLQASASQLQGGGVEVFELSSQQSPLSSSSTTILSDPSYRQSPLSPGSTTISADPSYIATTPDVSASESAASPAPKRRGRKRKADSFVSAEERKKKQNADAAKRYRLKKEKEQRKILQEKEIVEKELEATRRKVQKKMDERNLMLKIIYESYQDPKSALKEKYKHIVFPRWLPKWIKNEKEESE